MAAIERGACAGAAEGATLRPLLAAALALPGIVPATAAGQAFPDAGLVQFKYLDYKDWQPGATRMRVQSPSLYVLKPVGATWVVEGTAVYDGMSGASPVWFNTLSGASGEGVHDQRRAGDVKATRYFERFAVGAGGAYSYENDYISRAGSLDLRVWTADKNSVLTFGFAGFADRINTADGAADHEKKNVLDFLVGVTQAVAPTLIVQSNLTYTRGHGYYSDPYKPLDTRPDRRRILAWLTRANWYLPAYDASVQLGYRYLNDSFGANSNMVEARWAQPLPLGFSVTPGVRYVSQNAAWFYFNPPYPQGYVFGENYTADTRLSAFGAVTLGVVVAKQFDDGWSADLRVDYYRQDSDWRLGGSGSPGLLPFSARWIQVGLAKAF